ncbi:MAG: hypothetical protein D6696_06280 [Acidobacteria bacterium]|nr:MAG: hypothetical protein D6696_06280 [Acidobacteriota bacterium]
MIGAKLAERYELVAELGRGGMGVVYRARDPRLGREVAVKVLSPTLVTADAVERFKREARLVAALDHPAIVPIFDFGEHEDTFFYVMPLLAGTTLGAMLADGALNLGDALEIVALAAEALDHSHRHGVIHRDVKPENLMVSRDGSGNLRVRIMDFGLARGATVSRLTQTGVLAGTLIYLSPEQVRSEPVDGRSDLYSLGTILYQCLAGQPPFSGAPYTLLYRIGHEQPPPLGERGVDPQLEALVMRCLAKDPAARPKDCAELAQLLRQFRAELEPADVERPTYASSPHLTPGPSSPLVATTPFVGRQQELASLVAQLERAFGGNGQLVLVGGEQGMGKSRLLAELETRARARGALVLRGRFADPEPTFPYQGFCDLIQDFFRQLEEDEEPPQLADLSGELLGVFPVLAEIPALAAAAPATSPAALDAASTADRRRLFELLARTLMRLLAGRPAVLMLEQLHGADPSLEALEVVVRRLAPTRTLIAATYDPSAVLKGHPLRTFLRRFEDDPCCTALTLGPLPPAAHRQLVAAKLGRGAIDDAFAQQLYDATEGNPYFTEELLRALVEDGQLVTGASGTVGFSGATALSPEVLPETIQQAIEARLEHLPAIQRRLLSLASVLGRRFDLQDLRALADDADEADEAIERLIRSGLLVEERGGRGDHLSFRSSVVREVLLGQLPRRRRRALHLRHARQLEERWAGRLEQVYPQLVQHYSEADVAGKTIEYALRLARTALGSYSAERAVWAVEIGLDLIDDESLDERLKLEGELRLLLAAAHRQLGNVDAAQRQAARAMRALERAGDGAAAVDAARLAAETAWQRRKVDDTRRLVEKGIELARQLPPGEPLRRLLTLGATLANLRGAYARAKAYLQEAEAIAAAGERPADQLAAGGTLTTVLPKPVVDLDPACYVTVEDVEVLGNVFDTLLRVDATGNLVPVLCESWRLEAGGRRFEVVLRQGVRFSNGKPLTAAVVKRSLERRCRRRAWLVPAAVSAIDGMEEVIAGEAEEASGIEIVDRHRLRLALRQPLPIFPLMLSELGTAVALEASPDVWIGTGPYRIAERRADRVVLERNPNDWRPTPAHLERIVFRLDLEPAEVAAALRSERLDLGRDLLPEDLEELLRDPRFRDRLVEATKRNVYFALFNSGGPAAHHPAVRAALASVRVEDVIWRTVGRFARPASGLIPPGVLGHGCYRRPVPPPREQVLASLASAGLDLPIRLAGAVHPALRDRFGPFIRALLDEWAGLGLEVEIEDAPSEAFLAREKNSAGLDLLMGRWMLDYQDPDNVTYGLLHSEHGHFRSYRSPGPLDGILSRARRLQDAAQRLACYRQAEALLASEHAYLPLFHEIDYRLPGPRLRQLRLLPTHPFVCYRELAKVADPERPSGVHVRPERGTVRASLVNGLANLDPASAYLVEAAEVVGNVFETLTRIDEGAHVVPWLAEEVRMEEGGARFRLRLRDGVRFHNGRQLTAEDVRYSFEHLLRDPRSTGEMSLLPIRGARALRAGAADRLEGLTIEDEQRLTLDLEQPLSFFPAMLTTPTTAIVPAGSEGFAGNWRDGCAGTGPFRLVRIDGNDGVELEANPYYWRGALPRCDRLVFAGGLSAERVVKELKRGGISIAAHLHPSYAEELRRIPELAAGYHEAPGFSTYFLALNTRRGPFADLDTRRALADHLAVDELVAEDLGRLGVVARGLIPPGLLGYEAPAGRRRPRASSRRLEGLSIRVSLVPAYQGQYAPFWRRLAAALAGLGISLETVDETISGTLQAVQEARVDVVAARWIASFPDADSFANLIHSRKGLFGGLFQHPEVDALIDRGRSETDPALRHATYRGYEQLVADQALLVPLFHEQIWRVARPEIRGLRLRLGWPEVAYEELVVEP